MPDATTTVDQPKQTFTDFRAARGTTPQSPIPLDTTPISRQSAEEPKADPKPAAASEPASGQDKEKESRSGRSEQRIAELVRERADRERERDEARRERDELKAKVTPRESTDAPKAQPAPAAFAGTDPTDPRPEEPKEPSETVDASGKPWGSWADYQAAVKEYNASMRKFYSAEAAWTARAEWRKADARQQQAAQAEATRTQQQKDLDEFESTARKWAKSEGAEDFDGLLAEVKKRPILSPETGSVTMYGGEDGARLLYELMTHPDQLEEIENMPRAIDRLNALYELKYSLKYAKQPPERKPAQEPRRSAAPPAGTRVSGSGGPPSREPKSFADYRKQKYGA